MSPADAVRTAIAADHPGKETTMSERSTLEIIECPVCGLSAEVFQAGPPGEPLFGWRVRDGSLCRTPPVRSCETIRKKIDAGYPGHLPMAPADSDQEP